MTRWKREFAKWIASERLEAWYMPRKPEDYKVAQAASRVADGIIRQPHVQKRIHDAVVNDIMNGAGSSRGGLADLIPD